MISEKDLALIQTQIGRKPRGVRAIETRCPAGHPQVIRVYPLVDEKPFPTLFWLTCPELIAQISRLEHQGFIQRIELLIGEDEVFKTGYHLNHSEYANERWSELSSDDVNWIEQQNLTASIKNTGIGGIRDRDTVKCLHLHYAHHLARANVIGAWIDENFDISLCSQLD